MSRRRNFLLVLASLVGVGLGCWLMFRAPAARQGVRTPQEWVLLLADVDYRVRAEAENALLALGPEAFPALTRGLDRSEFPFRKQMLPLLVRFRLVRPGLPEAASVRLASARLFGRFGAQAASRAPQLVVALRDPNAEVTQEAGRSLRRIGSGSIPALLAGLNGGNPQTRARSAEVLGEFAIAAASTGPALLARLGDPEGSVRAEAARALGKVAPTEPQSVASVAERLDDREAVVRAAAAEALGHCHPLARRFTPALVARLDDRHPSVQIEVCRALWRLETSPDVVVPKLIQLLEDRTVGWQAAFLLGEIGPPASAAVPGLVDALQRETVPRPLRTPPSSAIALGKIGAPAVADLRPLLTDPRPSIRVGAVLALGMIGPPARDAAPTLFDLVQDRDAEVRTAAALALGSIDAANQRLVPLLKVLSREDDILIRSSALSLLRKLDPGAASEMGPE